MRNNRIRHLREIFHSESRCLGLGINRTLKKSDMENICNSLTSNKESIPCESSLNQKETQSSESNKLLIQPPEKAAGCGMGPRLQNLELNTNKAGMEGLDVKKINEIIETASAGSKFYEHKKKCQSKIDDRIAHLKLSVSKLTEEQIKQAEKQMDVLGSKLELTQDVSRSIVHIDMDMFYAAVEMRDNPSLKDKPMAVGSNSMLSTSNYAARKYGVRAAMPGFIGRKLCPSLVIVPCNFEKYREVSREIQKVFEEFDPQFCPMSLDEAYLDVTEYVRLNSENYTSNASTTSVAECVVEEIRKRIFEKTQLTASAGIAVNTRLAKVCSDMNKPNGQFYLPPSIEAIRSFVKELPIRKICGIGNVTDQQLRALGVEFCSDLWDKRGLLRLLFSETSYTHFMRIALGLGSTEVAPSTERDRKSISTETTFAPTSEKQILLQLCSELCQELNADMAKKDLVGKVLTLKLKTSDFQVRTRAQSLLDYTRDKNVLFSVAQKVLLSEFDSELLKTGCLLTLRLLGVRMSSFLEKTSDFKKQATLTQLLENMNTKRSSKNTESLKNSAVNALSNISHSTSDNWDYICNKEDTEDDFNIDNELNSEDEDMRLECSATPSNCDQDATQLYTCPVCSKDSFNDIKSLNLHLDSCLSAPVVKELVKESNFASFSGSKIKKEEVQPSDTQDKIDHFKMKAIQNQRLKRKSKSIPSSFKKSKKSAQVTNTLKSYLISE